MAEYRTVRMAFWNDPFIESLDPYAKLFYIYLFTGPHTNNLGLLEISIKKMSFETGLTVESIHSMLNEFEKLGKIVVDGPVIWMVNFIKNQTATSSKMVKGLQSLIQEVSSPKIIQCLFNRYKHLFNGIDTHSMGIDTLSKGISGTDDRDIPVEEVKREVKEEEEEEVFNPENSAGEISGHLDPLLEFVREFQDTVLREHGTQAPKITSSLIENGVDALRKAIRIDGHEQEEVKSALMWALTDSFWCKNVRSLAQMRGKMKNGLTKIQGVIEAYREQKPAEQDDSRKWRGAI